LEKNLDKIDWKILSGNPSAIHLLEKNLDKIDWCILSSNPNIFKVNYEYLNQYSLCMGINAEILSERFHPDNILKFNGWGIEISEYWNM
jgi:hypothetical protein